MTDQRLQTPYTLINTFTPVDGNIDALAAFQLSEMQDMASTAIAHGWLGNEVYRPEDASGLIVVTRFTSAQAKERWAKTERFRQHVRDLKPLIQSATSTPAMLIARNGEASVH